MCGFGFLYVNEKGAFHNNAMTENVRGHICLSVSLNVFVRVKVKILYTGCMVVWESCECICACE